jgi:hypothetical protein
MPMRTRTILILALLLMAATFLFFTRRSSATTTYYADFSSGSDANSGTSKASPWQHAPGMQTCTNVCSSTSINPGDSIILKGGVTWPNSSFMWNLPAGAPGRPIYIGVDKTWYAEGSWTRPILSAGGVVIPNHFDTMFNFNGWVTFDSLEITGFYWGASTCKNAPFGYCGFFNIAQQDGGVFENLYVHGWTHAGTNTATSSGTVTIFAGNGGPNGSVHDSVFSGTDVPGDHSVTVFFSGPVLAYNNYIRQVVSGFIVNPYGVGVGIYHDNYIDDIGPAYCNIPTAGACAHENGFEDNGDVGLFFYNNVITNVSLGLALWIAPNPGYTATMWNNVIYAVHDTQVLDMAPPVYDPAHCSTGRTSNGYCTTSGSYVFENNTVECGDDSTQIDRCQTNVGFIGSGARAESFLYQNNHFITATTAWGCATGRAAAANCTFAASNVVQTLAQAKAQGFNSSETYPFSPASDRVSTVGAGRNLTSAAAGNMASLAADTTLACRNRTGNTIVCPARSTKSRPATGSWNSGAYTFASGVLPTKLRPG